ncbi:RnaseH-domain-containing protein, partial [Cerioporus squamosus]
LHVVTDSKYAVDGLTKHLPEWEDRGWIDVKNAEQIKELVSRLRARSAITTFRWVKGHSGIPGNEAADGLATLGSEKEMTTVSRLQPPRKGFLKPGARLAAMSQKRAYSGIRSMGKEVSRQATDRMVARVCVTLEEVTKIAPTEEALWKAVRGKNLARKVRDFYWRAMHDSLRVGRYWQHIPGYEQRAECGVCGVEESIEHIMVECDAPGCKVVWEMWNDVVRRKGVEPLEMPLGVVLGSPTICLSGDRFKGRMDVERLYKIVVPELAYLIWKIRCERVIGRADESEPAHTVAEVAGRVVLTMRRRMELDWHCTNERLQAKPIPRDRVMETWKGV